MCVIGVVEVVTAVATAAYSVKNAIDEKALAKQQTKNMIEQAKLNEQKAAIERQEGIEEARRKKLDSILNMSEQKANIAASNLGTASQTSLNIIDDEKMNGELEALITTKEADKRVNAYMETSQKYYNQASLNSFNSKIKFNKAIFNSAKNLSSSLTSVDYSEFKEYFENRKKKKEEQKIIAGEQ